MGWDFLNFRDAIASLRAGHDPYLDALAVQNAYHAQLARHLDVAAPLSYVYSPATLPLLRAVGKLPLAVSGVLYWILFAAAYVVPMRVGVQWAEDDERRWVMCLAPFAVFFPGLLQSDVLFSGNIAILLYGCALSAAWVGWKKDSWVWFYATVLVASIFKAPMLSLIAIPVLSSRKQWFPGLMVGTAGVFVFCTQPLLWPSLFANYMKILDYMFAMARDFSSSPAGVLTDLFYNPSTYQKTLAFFYLAYAVPVVCVLLYLAPKYFSGQITLKQWAPVMMTGVILLNPRINEYDVAPITLALGLILWRALAKSDSAQAALLKMGAMFLAANVLTTVNLATVHLAWRWIECSLLAGTFMVGAGALLAEVRVEGYDVGSFVDDVVFEEELTDELAL
jgi:hypothetical protein